MPGSMREFKVSVKVKAIKGGPQRYTYNLDAFREARKTNFFTAHEGYCSGA